MSLIKSSFKRFNGTSWDIHYFRTSADIVDETQNFKILTAAERTAISDYLTTFNAANKLLKLDANGLIPVGLIPGGLDYLTTNNPTFTGILTGPAIESTVNTNLTITQKGSGAQNTWGSGFILENNKIKFEIGQGQGAEMQWYSDEVTSGILDMMSSNRIIGLNTPQANNEVATKGYVDGLVAEGVSPIAPVKAATTANITLSGIQTIDGFTLVAGHRVLVKNQTTASQNGIYTVASGAWTKVTAESTKGSLVFVENGTVNNDSKYYAETNTSWILFSRTDTYGVISNGGLQKVGTDFGIVASGVTNAMLLGEISVGKLANFASDDTLGWSSIGNATTSTGVSTHFERLYSAIKMLRGTANYNTNNTQTIADVYTIANAKNRTYVGNSDPSTSGFVEGDLFFQDLA